MTIQPHETAAHAGLADRIAYAKAAAEASLLPDAFKRQPANILIAQEVADALGKRPFMIMQEMAVISGKPSFSAKFMRGLVREAGHRLRETYEDGTARCEIVRKDDPDFPHVATWDEAKARQHDYWGKGHWRKNPELMLKNRALSECVREACPEVLGGVAYTPDEVEDFAPTVRVTQVQTPKVKPPTAADIMAESTQADPADHIDVDNAPPSVVAAARRVMAQAQQDDDKITAAQTRKMGAAMKAVGLTSRDESLAFVARTIGRDINSRSDLAKDEASQVIEALELWQESGADPTTGEVTDQEPLDAELVEPDGWQS